MADLDQSVAEDSDALMPDTVCIEIPATPRFVALTRVAAASLAADLDAAIDDVEDLRVAVNELVGLLVEATDERILVRMWSRDRVMHVTGTCTGEASEVEVDDLTRRILHATTDTHTVTTGAFVMHKRLPAV